MNGQFSFLEYSYLASDRDALHERLCGMGFAQRTKHRKHNISFWNQDRCIIMTREDAVQGITGIGYIDNAVNIANAKINLDTEIDMFLHSTRDGMRHHFVSETELEYTGSLGFNFEMVDARSYRSSGLEYISGLVLPWTTHDDYYVVGYQDGKSFKDYSSLITNNKRFSLLFRPQENNQQNQCLVLETPDIFATTAYLTGQGFESKQFDVDYDLLDFTDEIKYRIVAYNLLAYGNNEVYTIENFFKEVIPGIDIIVRQRKNVLTIHEDSLNAYYE